MSLCMVKVVENETGEPRWFFLNAEDHAEVLSLCEDSVSTVIEVVSGENAIKQRLASEFDGLALVGNV